jgi:ABC-type phosphate transport system substrate-binding protein
MRKLTKLFAGATTVVATAALVATTATSALADPPKGVTPQSFDIVGVGSDTITPIMDQLSVNFNATVKTHNATHPWMFSWDAVPPGSTSSKPTMIMPKAGCSAKTTRPNGSTNGWKALAQNTLDGKTGHYCIDFSRSSGARNPLAPKAGPGGLLWVEFAKDAVTWSTRAASKGGTNAPASLTLAKLQKIFTCKTTNWNQVGGKFGKIKVYLPQNGSGTLATWDKIMGIGNVGSCVSQAPEENEGTYSGFNNPNAVFIYSIGDWVAQRYHSAACGAKPKAGQNLFGCDVTKYLSINKISGISPMTSAKVPVINPKFPVAFFRTVYNVVRWTKSTSDHIPAYLEPLFSKTGFLCHNATAKKEITNYGFINTSACGFTS